MGPEKQFLCSHLITVHENGRRMVVNLERIWASGATINAEKPVDPGTEIHLPDLGTTALITFAEADDSGYYLDLEFPSSYRWSAEKFCPQHLTDPALIGGKEATSRPV